ncbi:unnamed protein product [Rotaria sordida]|uniref:Uncharacterized protein n=1 Tax=Rotaria sordida TaxID=392033 RepID=A0A819P6K2_9BILA|nr:unnamed protein product [Rotaria sordida]
MLFIRTSFTFTIVLTTLIIIDGRFIRKSDNQQYNEVHTWHTIISLNGTWYGTLYVMTENEHGIYFVDGSKNHSLIQNPFIISESSPFDYGLVISDEDDFNMLYSLTLNQQVTPDPSQSNSRICVYLIGARRAAYPQIIPVSFNVSFWKKLLSRLSLYDAIEE